MLCKSHRSWRNMREALRVEGLTLMIRATSSRSSRPNHMLSLRDNLQTLISVNPRRFPRDSHSVATRASFETQCFWIFCRFWSPGPPKMKPKSSPKSNFWVLFCCTFVDYAFGSMFHGCFEGPTLKIINFTKEKQRFSPYRRFRKRSKKGSILTPF